MSFRLFSVGLDPAEEVFGGVERRVGGDDFAIGVEEKHGRVARDSVFGGECVVLPALRGGELLRAREVHEERDERAFLEGGAELLGLEDFGFEPYAVGAPVGASEENQYGGVGLLGLGERGGVVGEPAIEGGGMGCRRSEG